MLAEGLEGRFDRLYGWDCVQIRGWLTVGNERSHKAFVHRVLFCIRLRCLMQFKESKRLNLILNLEIYSHVFDDLYMVIAHG